MQSVCLYRASWMLTACLLTACLLTAPALSIAANSLDFSAEHLLEAQMDARILALPEIESQPDTSQLRFAVGYLAAAGGNLQSDMLMLAAQQYIPDSDDSQWGYIFAGFLDYISLAGNTGNTYLSAYYVRQTPFFATPLNITMQRTSGSAIHAGISAAVTHRSSERWAWQTGLALDYYGVKDFKVNFITRDLAVNYSGEVDYSSNYNSLTPYFSFRYFYPVKTSDYSFSSRLLMAWPLPRRGFAGRITGPDYSVAGDTETAGNSVHIPDPFAGIGFSIESRQHGWRLDIGTSLWLFLFENKIHEDIDRPVFIHFNWPL